VVASAPLVPFRETVVTVPCLRSTRGAAAQVASPSVGPGSTSASGSGSGVNSCSAGLESTLPPPWKDIAGIGQVRRLFSAGGSHNATPMSATAGAGMDAAHSCGAMHRLVVTTQLVAITFRCFSLPSALANFLNPDVDEATSSNAHVISEFIASHKSGCDSDMDRVDGARAMRLAWDQLTHTILSSGGPNNVADEEGAIDHCLLDESDIAPDKQRKAASPEAAADTQQPLLSSLLNRVVSLGPHSAGPNMLLFSPDATLELYEDLVPPEDSAQGHDDTTPEMTGHTRGDSKIRFDDASTPREVKGLDHSKLLALMTQESSAAQVTSEQKDIFQHIWSRLRGSVVSGFQMLTASGPLMQEPLQGVCFSIEKIEVSARVAGLEEAELQALVALNGTAAATGSDGADHDNQEAVHLSQSIMFSTGQLISDVRDSLRLCMLGCALRLVEPIYKCSLQCDQLQLGGLYGVLSRRRGEVTDEDIIEGTSLFILTVSLPVANSFGFAQELLQKTSGSGTAPQLFFFHWYINDLDPFWKPTTSEEQEEHGTDGTVDHNLPRSFIDGVRRRKGLVVEEKMVASAEKQRTLSRKK
jgi:hypothetical protein